MKIKIFLCLIFLLFYPCVSSASGQCKTYKVKKGDTLYRISKKAGVSVKELKRLNRINKNIIKPGQILIISKQELVEKVIVEKAPGISGNLQLEESLQQSGDKIIDQEEQGSSDYPEDKEADIRNRLIQFALSFLDTPYRKGGTTLEGIDCSGLVWSVFRNAGIEIPRTVRELFFSGKPVEVEEVLPGDLIFFYTRRSSEPDHVGIYIGEDKFIHASRRARRVIIAELDSPYFLKRFAGIRRFLE
ncbi:MAG: NlpC/P60 family protein [Thermodesulfovibrionales bacterium]